MKVIEKSDGDKVNLIILPYKRHDYVKFRFLKRTLSRHMTLYISLTGTYSSLTKEFQNKKIKEHNYFIIDCVSNTLRLPKKEYQNCSYFTLPNNLSNLINTTNKSIDVFSPEYLLFDSLTNLILIKSVLTGKVSSFLLKIMKLKTKKFLFFCNQEDEKTFKYVFDKNKIDVGVVHLLRD